MCSFCKIQNVYFCKFKTCNLVKLKQCISVKKDFVALNLIKQRSLPHKWRNIKIILKVICHASKETLTC